MLSETPANHAVNFLTGAGGFLQQVIYGYTGLRVGNGGLETRFPPVLPSHIRRLVLRGVHVRGKAYDVIVDSAGRRMVPHTGGAPDDLALFALGLLCQGSCNGPLLPEDSQPAPVKRRQVAPVLFFPEQGMDDTAAYQGYATRLYRDSKSNTVQIYLDRQAGREVLLWADALDESAAFTARDERGRPSASTGIDSATVSDSADARTIAYRLDPRVERHAGLVPARDDARRARLPVLAWASEAIHSGSVHGDVGIASRRQHPAACSRGATGELTQLRASSVAELRSRLAPAITRGGRHVDRSHREARARREKPPRDGAYRQFAQRVRA